MDLNMLKAMKCEIEDTVAVITFDRPKVYNAINQDFFLELAILMEELDVNPDIRCIILTGGDRCFVSGADITMLSELEPGAGEQIAVLGHRMTDCIESCSKPTIAAIAGLSLGGGCEVALACDIRIATNNAKLGLPEINLGLIPGAGGTQRLAQLVGIGWAKQLILTGDTIDAQTAEKIGLVTKLTAPEELMPTALELAGKLSRKAPLAVNALKQCLSFSQNSDLRSGLSFEIKAFGGVVESADAREGTKAFVEKRRPTFIGK